MGICICCGRRGAYGCDCRPENCKGCGLCVGHCQCLSRPLDAVLGRLAAPDHVVELDDPSGPFADRGEGERGESAQPGGDEAVARKSDLARLSLLGRADDLLARMDQLTPANGDEMCSLFLERGWVEAVRHLARGGMLNPAGLAEAGLLLDASNEWADRLATD
jgi:hypothetical protein